MSILFLTRMLGVATAICIYQLRMCQYCNSQQACSKSIWPEQICSLYTISASSLTSPLFAKGMACDTTWPVAQLPIY